MNKPKFETPDITQENIKKIGALFPNCVTEAEDENGNLRKVVNFEMLKQVLTPEALEGDESYEFTWVGKKAAIVEANKPIRKTLRPCKEESVNWDTTENLYIEGDNLEVLKLLQESYLGKVKMIYIDPPYNTGKDFIYNDNFEINAKEYDEEAGIVDNNGNRMILNNDSDARFHSKWCSMMYSRLLLSRNLLTEDGVIFISIDDNEQDNLKKICSEIFGADNFINTFMWLHGKGKKDSWSRTLQQYVMVFAKNKKCLPEWTDNVFTNYDFSNPDNDPKGKWFSGSLSFSEERSNPNHPNYFTIESPSGIKWTRQWQKTKEEMDFMIANGDVFFGYAPDYDSVPREKIRPTTIDVIPANILSECGETRSASTELEKLMGTDVFDYPKPHQLISKLIQFTGIKDGIVMDFFSGSGTTAHSIFESNKDKQLKFVLVQLPEDLDRALSMADSFTKPKIKNAIALCDRLSRPHKLTEVGKERIRLAGKKVKDENSLTTDDLDIGFRVLKVDDSNMKDVYYAASEYDQGKLDMFESNIKEDRTDLDLLFGCLLDWGLPLSLPYTSETFDKFTVHTYNEGDLIACFNEDVSEDVVKEIARKKPLRAVFRDSSFSNSASKINVFEIFKMISPETSVKVI